MRSPDINLLELALEQVEDAEGKRVLNLGCGTGGKLRANTAAGEGMSEKSSPDATSPR